jgi:hypothetical protein
MILRPIIPSLPSIIAAVTLAIAIAAILIIPAGAARPDAPGDPDGDGLLNTKERFRGGDPNDADTDGLGDGDEARRVVTSPNDPDSDAFPPHPRH